MPCGAAAQQPLQVAHLRPPLRDPRRADHHPRLRRHRTLHGGQPGPRGSQPVGGFAQQRGWCLLTNQLRLLLDILDRCKQIRHHISRCFRSKGLGGTFNFPCIPQKTLHSPLLSPNRVGSGVLSGEVSICPMTGHVCCCLASTCPRTRCDCFGYNIGSMSMGLIVNLFCFIASKYTTMAKKWFKHTIKWQKMPKMARRKAKSPRKRPQNS